MDTTAGILETREERDERKKTTAYILATASVGFWVLGLAAILFSRGFHGSVTSVELVVSGAVAIATGTFLIVAIIVVWFDKEWLGEWNR